MEKFSIFTADDREPAERNTARMFEFTAFLNALSSRRKSHTVTPWTSEDKHETGFIVWYN